MSGSRLGRAMLATVGSAALASVLIISPAGAAPTEDLANAAFDRGANGNAQQTVAATYRKVYPDLSAKAAKAAATAQLRSEKLKDVLADRQAAYGGGWFDPYTASYHIAVTNTSTADDLATAGRNLKITVKTHLVERSLAQLEQTAAALRTGSSDLAKAAAGHVGIDVKTNQVVATVPATQAGAASRMAAPAGVQVQTGEHTLTQDDVCNSRADCDNSLRSGLVIRRAGTEMCSAGFTARSGGTRWLLTAGHCRNTIGETWSTGTTTQRTIGTATDSVNSGAADATAIQVNNAFYSGSSAGIIYINPSSTAPVKGKITLLVNDVVCISARFQAPTTSGNPCATVTNLSDSARRGQVRIEGYDACPGDSGGGWYWLPSSGNRYAAGLHSGSLSGCNASGAVSWASPLNSFWTGLTYETS